MLYLEIPEAEMPFWWSWIRARSIAPDGTPGKWSRSNPKSRFELSEPSQHLAMLVCLVALAGIGLVSRKVRS
jgi:hypothetical protein